MSVHLLKRISILTRAPPQRLFSSGRTQSDTCRFLQTFTDVNVEHCLQKWEWRDDRCFGEGGGVAYKVPTRVRHCARNAGSFSRFFRKAPPIAICCEKSRYLGKDRYVCVPVDFEKLSEYARNAAIKTKKRKLGKPENFRRLYTMGQKGSDYKTGDRSEVVRYSVGTGKFTTERLMTKAPVPANKVITDNFVDKRHFVSDGGSVAILAEPEAETVLFQDFDFACAYQKRPAINVGAMFSQQCSAGGQPPNRGKKPEKKKDQISVNLGKPRQAEKGVAARLKEPVAMACAMIKTRLKGHKPKNFGVERKKSGPELGPTRPSISTPAISTPSSPKCSADKSSTAKKEATTWNSSTYVGRKPFIQTCDPCKPPQPCRSAPAVPKWVPPVPPVSEPPKCPPPPPECAPAPPKCAPSLPRAAPAPPRCLLGPPPKVTPTLPTTPLESTTCTSEPPRCTESAPCHPPPPEAKACLCHSCSKTANSKVDKKCASELKPDCKPQTEPQAPPDPNAAAGRLEGCQLSFQQLEYERIKGLEEIPQLKVKTKPSSQTCSPPAVQSQSCPAKSQPCGAADLCGKASASQPCKEAAKPCSTTKNQPCGAASAAQASPSPAVKGRLSTDESKRCGTGCALQGLFPTQPDKPDAPPSCQGKQPPFSQSASRCVAEFLKKFKAECDPSQAAKQAPCPKEDPCRKDPCQADPCKKGEDPICTIRLAFPTANYLCKREETDPCKAAADPCGSIKKDPCKVGPCKASGADPCGSTKEDPSKAAPCAAKADLCATKADPCAPKVDPCAAKANSCAAKADPCAAKKAPCPKEDPCRKDPCQADPCKKDEDPICTICLTFPTANYLCKREETDNCKAAADPCGSIKKDPCKADPCKASGADPCGSIKKDPCKAGPCAPQADLCATKADPCASKVDPCAAKANSCAAKADPCAAKKDPCAVKVDPCVVKIEPCAAKKDPCAAKVDPCAAKKDPCAAKVDSFVAKVEPCATKKDPCAVKVDPCLAKKDPCAAKVDSCAAKKDPCAAKVDSFAAKVEPCAAKKDPCAAKVDSCAANVEPCATKKDPCAVKVDPSAAKKDPCAAKVDPCAAKKDPCAAKVDSCAAKVDPCATKKDPCAAKENPCAAKADPCAIKTDRCATKAVPCAAKVDPCAAKADLCAAKSKSDPCIVDRCKKDDPCKASADPSKGATKSTDPCGTLKPNSCGATKAVDPCGPAKAAKADPCRPSTVNPCKIKTESPQTCGLQKVDPCKASSSPTSLPCGSEKLNIYKDKPLSCPSANLPKASSLPCGSDKLDNKDEPTACLSANLPKADSGKADASSGSKSTCASDKKDIKTCRSANLPTSISGSKPCESPKDEKPAAKCSLDASSGDKKDPCSLLKRVDLKAPVKLGPDGSASKKCAAEAKGASKKDDAAAKKTIAAKGEAKIDSGPSKKTQTLDALNKVESATKVTAKSEAKDEPKKNFHLETCSSKEGKLTCNLAEKAPGPLKPGDNLMCAKEKVEKQERLAPKDELVRSRSDCPKAKTYESVMADKLQRVADYLLKQGKKDDDDDGSGKGGGGGGTPSAPVQKDPVVKTEQKENRCRVDVNKPKKNCDPKLDPKDKMVAAIRDPLMSFAKVCVDFEGKKRMEGQHLEKPEAGTSQEDTLVRLRHSRSSSYEELDNVPQVINKPVSCVVSAYGKQKIPPKQRKREDMGPQQSPPPIEVPYHLRQFAKNDYVEAKEISQLVSKAVLPQPKVQSCSPTEKRAETNAEKDFDVKLENKSTASICPETTAQNRVAPRKSFPMRKPDEDGYIRSQPDYVHPSRLPPKPPREIPLGKVSPKSGLLEWVRGIVEALMPGKDGGSKKCCEMPPPPMARLRITGSLCLNSSFNDENFGKRRSTEQWYYCRNLRE